MSNSGDNDDGPPPVSNDEKIGARLRTAREQAGLSQGDIADFIGLKYQSVQRLEKGGTSITMSRFFAVCENLDLPVTYFLQDCIDADGYVVKAGEQRDRLAVFSGQAREAARLFDRLARPQDREMALSFLNRLGDA